MDWKRQKTMTFSLACQLKCSWEILPTRKVLQSFSDLEDQIQKDILPSAKISPDFLFSWGKHTRFLCSAKIYKHSYSSTTIKSVVFSTTFKQLPDPRGHCTCPRYSILLWKVTICETYSWPPAAPASCFDCTLQLPPGKVTKTKKHSSKWETHWQATRDRGAA